jgi:cell division protein FtsL
MVVVVVVVVVVIVVHFTFLYICYAQTVKTLNERIKRPERVVAIAKQQRLEISRRGRFVTATTRSGM